MNPKSFYSRVAAVFITTARQHHVRPMMQSACCFLGVLLALTACGGSDESSMPPSAQPSPPPAGQSIIARSQGYFVGTVGIGNQEYFGDALLTVDGAIRLYVGGPYDPTGVIQRTKPESSVQFVGTLQRQGGEVVGRGFIMGQGCAAASPGRFCGVAASGEISLTMLPSGYARGTLRVSTNGGEETWSLNLGEWSHYYHQPATGVTGIYKEELAEFSIDSDTIVRVDLTGQLSFQSPRSGCTGNGALTPHLDGKLNVFDVVLTIENCSAPYSYLNGRFEGLASYTPGTYWDYDSLLRIWVSKPDQRPPQAALTLLGQPV